MKHFLECEDFFGDDPNASIKFAHLYGTEQTFFAMF